MQTSAAVHIQETYLPVPYIGVTGIKTVEEVRQLAKICSDVGLLESEAQTATQKGRHAPMFGFLCSDKRLLEPRIGGTQSPAARDLASLARATPKGAIPMLHYHSGNKEKLADEVCQLFDSASVLYQSCKALQINMDWPLPTQVEDIRKTFADMQIVLQLPKRAMIGFNVNDIATRVGEYQGLVQYVLVDPSGGKGLEFDIDSCSGLIERLHDYKEVVCGIAGGLDGTNVGKKVGEIASLIKDTNFCMDAQGRLRTPDKTALDMSMTQLYLAEGSAAFERAEQRRTV